MLAKQAGMRKRCLISQGSGVYSMPTMMRCVARTAVIASTLLLLVLPTSCAPLPRLRGPHRALPAYRQALVELTRSGHVFVNVDREITVFATRLTSEFRRMLQVEYRRVFGFALEKGRGSLERLLLGSRGAISFFLYTDTSEFAWGQLDSPDAVWKLSVRVAGPEAWPCLVRHIESPAPTLQAFFPFIGEFGLSYLATCALTSPGAGMADNGEAVKLLLASAFGKLQLAWP